MATFREQSRPAAASALVALMLLVAAFAFSTCFTAAPLGAQQLRTPVSQLGVGPRLASGAPEVNAFEARASNGSLNLMLSAAAAAVLFATSQQRTKVQRKACIDGFREIMGRLKNSKIGDVTEGTPPTKDAFRNHLKGQTGFREMHVDPMYNNRAPARMFLGKVNSDQAMRIWKPQDFNVKVPKASLTASDVKEVGSVMTKAEAPDELISPAQVPNFTRPKNNIRLEKEPGEKRPPKEDAAYEEYLQGKRFGLCEQASKAGASMAKDIVCERSSLMLLLSYLMGDLTPLLMKKGSHKTPVDLIKITKNESGKGIVLERIFEKKNLWAQHRKQERGWVRWEMSNHGTYMPAWIRACTEGKKAMQSYMCTGLKQIAGTRDAGQLDKSHQFVEFDMGGLSFLSKVPAHAKDEGKDVELTHKNWYYQEDVKLLDTYWKMLLGKKDLFVLGIHRSGKLVETVETTLDAIVEKKPAIVEAAEIRMGWLVELLKQVSEAVSKDGDGPWVLQWQQDNLVLGKYEKVVVEESEQPKEREWVPRLRTPEFELPEYTRIQKLQQRKNMSLRPKAGRVKTEAPGHMG